MSEDEVATLVGNGKSVVGVRVNRGIAYGEVSVSTYIQLTCNQDAQTLMLAEEIAGDMARKYSESFLRCILEDLNNEAAGGST